MTILEHYALNVKNYYPANNYMFKVNNRNLYFKITLPRGCWSRSGLNDVNFEHILHFVLVFLLLTLNM